MEISAEIQTYITEKGLMLSAIFLSLKLLSWRLDKTIWLGELSDGKYKGNHKAYLLYLFVYFGSLLAFLHFFDKELLSFRNDISQVSLFVINIMIYGVVVVAMLFIHDFIIYSRLKPKLMALKEIDFVSSPMHHIKYAVRWYVVGAIFCFIASILASSV